MLTQDDKTFRALNILAKWRVLFAGWQLGTRPKGDPECDAVSDHRELSIIMRAELNALIMLLIQKGIFTKEEYSKACETEAYELSKDYEQKFPGVKAVDSGLIFSQEAVEWMSKWKA